METNSEIGELVRTAEDNYITGETTISKYVQVSQYETLNKIDAYLNSRHTSGDTDSQGREKPFFNIVTSAVNIWYRATDIDRKKIKVRPVKSTDDVGAFLATVHLQNWMRKESFGQFLNEWGRTLAKYGSAVSKHVRQDGKLHSIVVPWNRLITDTVDFDSNPVIEKFYLTPAQLKSRKGYDKELVKELLDALTSREDLDRHDKDTKADYIELYEIHGELPKSFLTGKESDEDEFLQQMQVITFIASKNKGDYDDYVLIKGKEAKSPYQKDDLIKEDGQTLGIGAVQNLFEAQWMLNHSVKAIKDQLDLASKLIFQTSDTNFVGQNVLSAIETGDILIHAANSPLTQVANSSHDITSLQSFAMQWKTLGNEINGISEAMMGANQPSGSAWRQTEALLAESHSLFELMTENKGLALERMLREFIIPYLKTKMDTSEEISATLDSYNLSKIDSRYINSESVRRGNKQMIEQALSEDFLKEETPHAQQADFAAIAKGVQSDLSAQGNQRFFKPSEIKSKTWKERFKDLEFDLEVDTTGESRDIQAAGETIMAALKVFTQATPQQLADPNWKLAFNKMLELSGEISPIEIASLPPSPAAPPTSQQQQPQMQLPAAPVSQAMPIGVQ